MCRRKTKIFCGATKKTGVCPQMKTDGTRHSSLRQATQFVEQALKSLPDGIRGCSIKVCEFFSVGSVQFELNEEIQFGVRQHPLRHAAIQEVAQQCVSFERFLGCESSKSLVV